MTDADSAVRLQERLHTLLSREDVTGAEKMKALRALALFCPSDGIRWAALCGSWPERAASFLHRALILAPGDFRLHVNFSNRNLKAGGARAAMAGLKRAALLEPGFSRCYASLAALMTTTARRWTYQSCAWQSGGAGEAALGQVERQIARGQILEPLEVTEKLIDSAVLLGEAWRLRAVLLQRLYRNAESQRCHCRALVCDPARLSAYIAASGYFIERRSFSGAGRLLDFADRVSPGSTAVLANRASILERTGQLDGAMTIAKRLTVLDPRNGERYFTCGTIFHDSGDIGRALDNMRRAAIAAPQDRRFQNNIAIMLLKAGRYEEGLAAYEGRWYAPVEMPLSERSLWPRASFDLPLWEPEHASAGKILLWGEQGVGDEIWGLAYLTALSGRPERFVVETDSRLVPLVRHAFPGITALPRRLDVPVDTTAFQAQLPLLSLPHRLKIADQSTPSGWIQRAPDRVSEIRCQLAGGKPTRLIGLAWRTTKPLQHRSFEIGIDSFEALRDLEDTKFVPLQYGMRESDWEALGELFGQDRIVRPAFDVRDDLVSLADTIAAVDVIVTLATALVPMAGAVGTPSIVMLLPVQRDWRYRVAASRSPMLPHATLLWPPESDDPAALRRAVARIVE